MKLTTLKILLLIATILICSSGWAQNNNRSEPEKKYCFDSVQVIKINKKFAECDYLKTENTQLLKSDSINTLLISDVQKKMNNLNSVINEKDKIINELLSRPPTIINNAKWYYFAGSVVAGVLLGIVVGFAIK